MNQESRIMGVKNKVKSIIHDSLFMIHSRGFTLIELIVVLSITAVLGTIGLAGFTKYNQIQVLQASASEVSSMLTLARSRAQSQVKLGASCSSSSQSLEGYSVDISISNKTYSLNSHCSGAPSNVEHKTLPTEISFINPNTDPNPPRCDSNPDYDYDYCFFFPIQKGGVEANPPTDRIILQGYNRQQIITINTLGGVSLLAHDIVPTSTPIPTPTSAPSPTPIRIPTPTPTSTPAPTPMPTVGPTAIPLATPTPPANNGTVTIIVANPPASTPYVYLGFYDTGTQQWIGQQYLTRPTFPFTSFSANISGPHVYARACIVKSNFAGGQACWPNDGVSTDNYSQIFPTINNSIIYFDASQFGFGFDLTHNSFTPLHSPPFGPGQNTGLSQWYWTWWNDVRPRKPLDFVGINTIYYPSSSTPSVSVGEQFNITLSFVNPTEATADMVLDALVRRPDGTTFSISKPNSGDDINLAPGRYYGTLVPFIPTQLGTYTANFTLKANGVVVGQLNNIVILRTAKSPVLAASSSYKRVFFTSGSYNGDLKTAGQQVDPSASISTGLDGANAICRKLAGEAGLGTNWKAWISNSATFPAANFTPSKVPYWRLDKVPIANNWNDLTDGILKASISIDENGKSTFGVGLWTNTTGAGYAGSMDHNCNGWTSSSSGTAFVGYSDNSDYYIDSQWTYLFDVACVSKNSLYCFEQ